MPEYNSNLRALNDILGDYGLPGGHRFEIDALNALAVHLGGAGGHQFNIGALNEIVGLVEGSGTFQFEIDAYNEISRALGGRSDFQFVEDALSEISDLPPFEQGGGGEEYVAQAAQFDGNVTLFTEALQNGVQSPTGTFFVWQKISNDDYTSNNSYCGNGSDGQGSGQTTNFYVGPDPFGKRGPVFQVNSLDFNDGVTAYADVVLTDDVYHLVAMSWDTDHASGNRIVQILVDGTVRTNVVPTDDGSAFDVDWQTPTTFFIGSWHANIGTFLDGISEGWIGSLCDFFLDINIRVDLSDPLVLAKIVDGSNKPVSLGPTGSLLTGQQPLFYLGGSRTNYHDNLGNGGSVAPLFWKQFTGGSGSGPVPLLGAQVGQTIRAIKRNGNATDLGEEFESVISVADEIQQVAAEDHSGHLINVLLSGGTLPEAPTSPSG